MQVPLYYIMSWILPYRGYEEMEYIVLLVLGLLAGTIGSLVGLGGGIIIVPSLYF